MISDFTIDQAIRPDLSLRGLGGLVGQGDVSGFKDAQGNVIARDPGHGSQYSSVLASKNPEAVARLSESTGGKVALTLADIGVDPLTAFGLGSGVKAVTKARGLKGLVPFNRALGLQAGGIEGSIRATRETLRGAGVADDAIEGAVQGVLRERVGKRPGFAEAILGREDVGEFFEKGTVFNRNPVAQIADRTGKILTDAPVATPARLADAIQPKVISEPVVAKSGIRAAPGQTFGDILADEANAEIIMSEAQSMIGGRKIYGAIAEDTLGRTMEALYDPSRTSFLSKTFDPAVGEDPINAIRSQLKGKVRHSIRKEVGEAGKLKRTKDVLSEISPQKFSLQTGDTAGREAVAAVVRTSPNVQSVQDVGDGLALTMKNGEKGIVRFTESIESPIPGQEVAGRFMMELEDGAVIDLTNMATKTTPDHEMVHWARRLGLFEADEWSALGRRYGESEEAIAEGLAGEAALNTGVIQKIKNFFVNMYESVTGKVTESGAARRWQGGEVFERPVKSADRVSGQQKFSHVKPEQSTLSKATNVQSMFKKKGEGVIANLRDPEFRSKALKSVIKKLQDKSVHIADAMKKLPENAKRAPAYQYLRTLPGMYARASQIIVDGIHNPLEAGKSLYKKNFAEATTKPLTDYVNSIKKSAGKADYEKAIDESNVYAAGKQAKYWYDEAMNAVTDLISRPNQNTSQNQLVYRGIITDSDVSAVGKMSREDGFKFLSDKVEAWAASNTGLSKNTGLGSDLEAANRIIADVEADPAKLKAYDAVVDEMNDLRRAALEYATLKGNIPVALFDSLKTGSQIPLMRDLRGAKGMAGTVAGEGGLKVFKGSEKEILSPISSTIDSVVGMVKSADENFIFSRWAQDAVDAGAEYMEDVGMRQVRGDTGVFPDTGNVKRIMVNGEEQFWEFTDNDIFNSIEDMSKSTNQTGMDKILGAYKNFVSTAITKSPGFPLRNFVRDAMMMPLVGKFSKTPFGGLKGFGADAAKAYDDFGALQSGLIEKSSKAYTELMSKNIRRVAKDKNTIVLSGQKLKDITTGAWDKWGDIVSKGEKQNRLAEFVAAQEDLAKKYPDMPQAERNVMAAFAARDTMDFAVIGEWTQQINKFSLFLNPAIQGTSKVMKTFFDNPKEFSGQLMKWIGLPSIGTYLYNVSVGADKEYQNLPAYRRDMYWNFKVGSKWLVIPKPFEAGVLGTLPERLIDFTARGGDTKAFDGYAGSLLRGVSPVDEGLLAGPFRPVIEILANRDLFRDRYIVPPWEEGLDPKLRKGAANASAAGKALSSITGKLGFLKDPRQIDFLLQSLGAEYGRAVTDFSGKDPVGAAPKILTGGFLRKDSPWAYNNVQAVMDSAAAKGETRRKGFKEYIKQVRGAAGDPTRQNIDKLFRSTEREQQRLDRVTISDILERRRQQR
jgi:hypothetical protein